MESGRRFFATVMATGTIIFLLTRSYRTRSSLADKEKIETPVKDSHQSLFPPSVQFSDPKVNFSIGRNVSLPKAETPGERA
jgi:hypothetical protein